MNFRAGLTNSSRFGVSHRAWRGRGRAASTPRCTRGGRGRSRRGRPQARRVPRPDRTGTAGCRAAGVSRIDASVPVAVGLRRAHRVPAVAERQARPRRPAGAGRAEPAAAGPRICPGDADRRMLAPLWAPACSSSNGSASGTASSSLAGIRCSPPSRLPRPRPRSGWRYRAALFERPTVAELRQAALTGSAAGQWRPRSSAPAATGSFRSRLPSNGCGFCTSWNRRRRNMLCRSSGARRAATSAPSAGAHGAVPGTNPCARGLPAHGGPPRWWTRSPAFPRRGRCPRGPATQRRGRAQRGGGRRDAVRSGRRHPLRAVPVGWPPTIMCSSCRCTMSSPTAGRRGSFLTN